MFVSELKRPTGLWLKVAMPSCIDLERLSLDAEDSYLVVYRFCGLPDSENDDNLEGC